MINRDDWKNSFLIVSNEHITVNEVNAGSDALMEFKGNVTRVTKIYPFPLLKKNGHWISVTDRLPEKETSVLIFVPSYNEIHTAEFCEWQTCNDWHISFGKNIYDPLTFEQKEVSHWMPLPEPPK